MPRQEPPAPRRRSAPEPLTDPNPVFEQHRALERELETLRADKDSLTRALTDTRAEVDALRGEAAELRAAAAEQQAEIDELSALAKQHRLQAVEAENELERAKDRIGREAARELEQKRRAFVCELLQVLDDLDRALAVARSADADTSLIEGVELVRKSFLAKLEAHDIRHEPAAGKPFDPARHQAVSTAPVEEPALDRVVVAVVREGYRVGDEILRPADVVVGKYAAPA